MVSDLLTAAKQYEERCEWEKAIWYYERYKQKHEQNDVLVYISYAKCLRYAGWTDQAKELLMEGKHFYPNEEQIFQEFYALYKKAGEWKHAKSAAETLIELNPQQETYYFQLGRACAFLKENEKVKQAYISGLKWRHGLSYDNLIENIKRRFTTDPSEFLSEYIYINGKNNYGAIIHYSANKTYITKITKYDKNAKREEAFYRDVCSRFPQLKEIIPAYIDSRVKDRILYMTIEWLEGSEAASDSVKDILITAKQISSIHYQDIIPMYSNPSYVFQFRNKPTFIIQFFTQIHKKYYNEKLFSELYKLIKHNHYPASINQVIQRLEAQIMDHCLYVFIDPRKHYSLLHGDFHLANMKVTAQHQAIKVFDWASFTTGPHFVDSARYLSKSLFSYDEVKAIYLNNEQFGGKLTRIEKIFFLYALILLYLLRLKANEVENYRCSCIEPALEDLEVHVTQFIEEDYASSLVKLREEKNNQNQQVKLLEETLHRTTQQNIVLKKQVQNLKRRHKHMKESKSWKITAPLRKFVRRKNKDQKN